MSGQNWFYVVGQQRVGPVTIETLRDLAARGELRPEQLVWTEGSPQWSQARNVPGIFDADGPAAAIAGPAHPDQSLGYYARASGMPPRAARALAGHAPPFGDVGDWPLDDARVAQFRETYKLRRKIFGAAQLYRGLFALSLIAAVVFLMVMVGTSGRRGPEPALAVGAGIMVGVCVLYVFAWRATMRSHRWAPLTMFVLFMIGVVLNLVSMVMAFAGPRGPDFNLILPGLLGMILPAVFAVVSWRAFTAIPAYLARPAWTQELAVTDMT
jgi:hypothetical protein